MTQPASGGALGDREPACLYEAVLGASFDALPQALRDFHSVPGRRTGTIKVTRGPGLTRALVATILRLPPAGDVDLELETSRDGAGERWDRKFGDYRLRTRQWARGGLLMERTGPACFAFTLSLADEAVTFRQVGCWFGPLRLPRWLAPNVSALAGACAGGWRIEVVISTPGLGMVTKYEGVIECP